MDLKVGGAGMKAFYGNVLPATLKPLLRKLGGAGLSQIQLGGGSGQPNEVSINGTVVSDVRTGNKLYFAGSPDEALQWSEDEGYTVVSALSSQLGFAITPKMRDLLADGVPLFSFAGPQALTANLQSMVGAQTRIEEGDDPEVVRQETGWFAGADGRLRFEIDDSQAFAKGTDAYGDLLMRWYHAGVQRTGDQAYKVRLGDVLYHAKLFDAYPGLADLEVQMMPAGVAARGRLVIENGQPSIIQINEFLDSKTWVNVVLHELQHAIQEIERFEPGSSPADFAAAPSEGQQVVDVSLAKYQASYRRSAGEVEARNVQARQNLSQRERQATPPASTQDVADPILLGLRDKLLTDTDRAAVLDMGDGVIRVQRAQTGGGRLRAATGEAGDGIYAYFPKSVAMRNYYVGKRGQFDEVALWDIDLDANRVVDLTLPANMTELLAYARAQFAQLERSMPGYVTPVVSVHNIQRFGRIVEGFVRTHRPWAGAWIIGHKGPGIPTSRQVVISDESAMLSAVERPKALVRPTLSVSELQAKQEWLSALFGEQAPATAVPAVGMLELKLDNEEVARSLRAFAAQKQAEATEWASRQYKFNQKPLFLRGDGPRREETISVQRANESRRRKMVDAFMAQVAAATDLALKVEAGLDFSGQWKSVEAAVERDIARNGGVGHAHGTKERMTEAYASTMLLGDAYGAFGDGALSSHLRQLVQVARGEVADVAMSVSDAYGRLTNKGMSGIDQEPVHLVPFSSSQVKSTTGNSGAYDPSQADKLLAKEVGVAQPGRIVFHVTTSRALPFLLGGGIEPRVGARSKEAGEAAPRSYHFACAQDMDDALCGWLADAFDEEEDLAVVAVDVSGLAIEESPAGYEVQVLDHIDPERLCLVHNRIDSLTPSRLMALSSQALIRLQARTTERADAVDVRQAHSPHADRAAQVAMSFAGERAQTADLQSLRAARWKVANGVQSREAWQTQGWAKGADGKWRFEIDDSRACVNLAMLRNIAQGPVCAGMPEVKSITYRVNKTANGQELFDVTLVPPFPQKLTDIAAFTAIDADTAEELLGKDLLLRMKAGEGTEDLIGDFEPAMCFATPGYVFGGFNALPLDRVLNHPALFKAYPKLADVLVTVDPSFESVAAFVIQDCEAGGRSFVRRLIRLRSVEIGQPQLLSALLHEVQHAIQEIEGFAPGGSAETAARYERSMRYQMTEQALTRLHSLKGRFPATYESYNDMQTHFFACLSSHGIDAFGADGCLRDLMSLTRALQAVELPEQAQRRHQLVDSYRTCMEREVGEFGSPGQQLWGQAVSALSAARMATPEPAQEVYRKLAGEVEARNVQFRILFDEERRKNVEPADSEDVGRDEQIVMSCI
ncbi:MAG: hypothetical protein K2W33_07505 [Burkholderiales bacterium]|nr:hypothetical protein [Burkholderiales bacterium]